MVEKKLKAKAETGFEEISEEILLNPDYYMHKIIMEIIQAPKSGLEFLIVYVDMLEKVLKANKVITDEDVKEMEKQVAEYIKEMEKKVGSGLDTRTKTVMRFNKKFELLLERVFAMRPEEGVVRI